MFIKIPAPNRYRKMWPDGAHTKEAIDSFQNAIIECQKIEYPDKQNPIGLQIGLDWEQYLAWE